MKKTFMMLFVAIIVAASMNAFAATYALNWAGIDTNADWNPEMAPVYGGPWGFLEFTFTPTQVIYDVTINPAVLNDPDLLYGYTAFFFNVPDGFSQANISTINGIGVHPTDEWYFMESGSTTAYGQFDFGVGSRGSHYDFNNFNIVLEGSWTNANEADFLNLVSGPQSPSGGDFFAIYMRTFPFTEGYLLTNAAAEPIPEPSTMVLLGSGLAGLIGWGRKRLRK